MKIAAFNFDGGKILARLGASWFTSYLCHEVLDRSEMSWKNVKTFQSRIGTFNESKKYHEFWIGQVCCMDEKRLSTNEIGLSGEEVKKMAERIYKYFNDENNGDYYVEKKDNNQNIKPASNFQQEEFEDYHDRSNAIALAAIFKKTDKF